MPIVTVMTWSGSSNDYNNPGSWDIFDVPSQPIDIALFNTSTVANLLINGSNFTVGEWIFNSATPQYSFTMGPNITLLGFAGEGIVGGSPIITMTSQSILFFYNSSTAGSAVIADNGNVLFEGKSTAAPLTSQITRCFIFMSTVP